MPGASEVVETLAEYGTALLRRTGPRKVKGKRHPGTAEVFTALVDGIACGAILAEGGVRIGMHFDAQSAGEAEVPRPTVPGTERDLGI